MFIISFFGNSVFAVVNAKSKMNKRNRQVLKPIKHPILSIVNRRIVGQNVGKSENQR